MTRYQLEIFEYSHYAQKSFKYVAEALTPLLRLGTFSWIVTCDSHKKFIPQFPTSVAAHQAEVHGPPVGRSPQVENRWYSPYRPPLDKPFIRVKTGPPQMRRPVCFSSTSIS